jgi:hypothetical protein
MFGASRTRTGRSAARGTYSGIGLRFWWDSNMNDSHMCKRAIPELGWDYDVIQTWTARTCATVIQELGWDYDVIQIWTTRTCTTVILTLGPDVWCKTHMSEMFDPAIRPIQGKELRKFLAKNLRKSSLSRWIDIQSTWWSALLRTWGLLSLRPCWLLPETQRRRWHGLPPDAKQALTMESISTMLGRDKIRGLVRRSS